jgi:hypothetical protein
MKSLNPKDDTPSTVYVSFDKSTIIFPEQYYFDYELIEELFIKENYFIFNYLMEEFNLMSLIKINYNYYYE